MKNKRLTIQRIDKFIKELSLNCRELEYQGRKSVKIKGATNGPENLEHDGRTSH